MLRLALSVVVTDSIVGYCEREIWNNVTFVADVSGGVPPYTYVWDFGDGTPNSTLASPTHSFALSGNHTVSVTVHDSNGSSGTGSVTFILAYPPCALRVVSLWVPFAVAAVIFGAAVAVFYVAPRTRRRRS